MDGVQGVVHMGKPKHVVLGNISMRLSTSGVLVDSLMPRKDNESLVRVLGELTQNVMDWAFGEAIVHSSEPTRTGINFNLKFKLVYVTSFSDNNDNQLSPMNPAELDEMDEARMTTEFG